MTPVVFWIFGEKALAQYQRGHSEVSLDTHPSELDAQPLTPPSDLNPVQPAI
ncbi:hypothetical protein ACFQT0_29360 [Hymenobacter humi]|uniref:Uncharacterized protein n=1 Tax=Hymenobacter humi TaxID=1411620 RepID=A0ABW2UDV7_9BACT